MDSFGVAEKLSHEDFRSREAVGRQKLWHGQEALAERFPMRVPNGRILSLGNYIDELDYHAAFMPPFQGSFFGALRRVPLRVSF